VLIDVESRRRVDVLSDRRAATLEAWLRTHPGVEIVCRDGSGVYAEAIRRALPQAVQVSDRWHLWHNLCEVVIKEVAGHSRCWSKGTPAPDGVHATTTRQRWTDIHTLLDQGVGLLECARRLELSLNTVQRYARITEPERLQHAAIPIHTRRPLPGTSARPPRPAARGQCPDPVRRDHRPGL
jgi:hypothetical protein